MALVEDAKPEGNHGSVLVLDDDRDMLEALGDTIRVLGGRPCITVASHAEMVALGAQALACSVAILDINLGLGMPSGIDAYRWLRESGFGGRIVFLTGHARGHPLVEEAHRLGEARVLEKPARTATLLEIVRS
jgi:FixJ family two-component response regulator